MSVRPTATPRPVGVRALVRLALTVLTALAVPLLGMLVFTGAPGQAQGTGTVYLLQGLPGRNIDLYSNGTKIASNVAPKAVVGPLSASAGSVAIKATAAGSATALVQQNVTVAAGQSVDAIVHLSADAQPVPLVTVFVNDLSALSSGKVRLAVAHTADVPAADIRVDGKVLFSNVANGEGLTTVVPAGSYSVEIVPTGTTGPAILGPATFAVTAGTLTRVFAIGQPATQSMDAIVQVLKVAASGSSTTPARVNTGSGGRAEVSSAPGLSAIAGSGLIALGGALLAGCGLIVLLGLPRRTQS